MKTLQERLLPHYVQLAMGGAVTMPDGLDFTYRDLAQLAGNGHELTFAQFIDWAAEYMERPQQLSLALEVDE